MKKILIVTLTSLTLITSCTSIGIITHEKSGKIFTIAGGCICDGGKAKNTKLYNPQDITLDNLGNLYIADSNNYRIRKVDLNGIITTVAGNGISGYSGDGGQATNAKLNNPQGIEIDSTDNLYIADNGNHRIRKVSSNGIISTVAGYTTQGFSGDGGKATNAKLNNPKRLVMDKLGNLYISDYISSIIRKVDLNGIISTVAGSWLPGYEGDKGQATDSKLNNPEGIEIDNLENLYIADSNNHRIRKVDSNGIITTVVGNGTSGYSGDGGKATDAKLNTPKGIEIDSIGNLYIADNGNSIIRKVSSNGVISTIVGANTFETLGDGGQGTNSQLSYPQGITLDNLGNLYIADSNNYRISLKDKSPRT